MSEQLRKRIQTPGSYHARSCRSLWVLISTYWLPRCVSHMTCAQISLTNIYTVASIDCKHAFSLNSQTVTPWCTSLSDESIWSSVLLDSWTHVMCQALLQKYEGEFMETLNMEKGCPAGIRLTWEGKKLLTVLWYVGIDY